MESPRFSLGLVILLIGALASSVPGQETRDLEGSIGIGPLKLVVDVAPGETWKGSFRIVGGVPGMRATFDVEVRDLAQSLGGYKESVDKGTGARSASDWVVVEPEVSVEGLEQRDVPVSVSVPGDAFGAYSSLIVVRLRRKEPTAQLSAAVIPSANVEILVRVRSSGPLELGIERIEFRGDSDELLVDVRNSGVWVSEIRGDVLIYPETGGFPQRAEIPYRSDGRPHELYPGQRIQLGVPTPRVPLGKCRVIARLDLGERRESRSEFVLVVGGSARGAPSATPVGSKTEIGTDLWLEQPVQEISLQQGGARSLAIRVKNLGEGTMALKVAVGDARLETDGRWTYADSPVPTTGLTVEVAPDTLLIGPKGSAAVKATVSLAADASLTSPVAKGVRFLGRADREAGEWQTAYDAGAIIIVDPKNRGGASLEIESLELVRFHPSSNPGSAVLTVANVGEGVGEIKGRVWLHSEAGALIAEMTIGSTSWERVMPGSQRKFRMPLPLVDAGVFVVEAELEQNNAPGKPLRADASFTSAEAVPEGLR